MKMFGREIVRKHGVGVALIAGIIVWTLIVIAVTKSIVKANTIKEVESRCEIEYNNKLEEYKKEEAENRAKEYWLSGDASKESAMNQDAIALAQDGNVWKTEEAFKTHCWNVVVRKLNPNYPNSIKGVLEQDGQYAYHDKDGTYSEEKFEWALEVLKQADTGKLPAYLTVNHVYIEMRDNGKSCVLHTTYDRKGNDDPWKLRE